MLKCLVNKTYITTILCFFVCTASIAQAAESTQSTILNGKVISPVTRAKNLPFNAIVEEILVAPGQNVMQDQVIMTYTLEENAERTLQKEITTGAGTEVILRDILNSEQELIETKAERNKANKLAAAGLGSRQASNRLDSNVEAIRKNINILKQTYAKQEANFQKRLEELSEYFGTTIEAGATLPKKLVLLSPMDGHVLSVAAGLYPGTQLAGGSTPIVVGKMDPMLIQVQVYEGDMDNIKVGDIANVTIPSLDDKVFKATVAKIAWTSNNMNVDTPSYFTVELTVPNPDLELKPGFKAIIQFN